MNELIAVFVIKSNALLLLQFNKIFRIRLANRILGRLQSYIIRI